MGNVHTKDTYISLDSNDISTYCNNSEYGRSADTEDTTPYGADGHVYDGSLTDGTAKIEGFYDNTAAGPKAVVEPLLGTKVTYVRRVEGTGTGKPEDSMDVVVKSYNETSPVAGHVKWSAELQISGTVTNSTQA